MSIEIVCVDLGMWFYDVCIGQGLLDCVGVEIVVLVGKCCVVIVMDMMVVVVYLLCLIVLLNIVGLQVEVLVLFVGEVMKFWDWLGQVVEWLIVQWIECKDLVIVFGGGVIGDLVGFVSVILCCGVCFVQILMMLLVQVDSFVGGKIGINSLQGKNLIGVFYQFLLVLVDIDVLGMLVLCDFCVGYGEVVKYGLLGDEGFFEWLEIVGLVLVIDFEVLQCVVCYLVVMKVGIVQCDEIEQGECVLLNFGYIFGYVLELVIGYSDRLLYGEGVVIGCMLVFEFLVWLGLCSQEVLLCVVVYFVVMGMFVCIVDIFGDLLGDEVLIVLMGQDKKVMDGKLCFIFVWGIGQFFVIDDVDLVVLCVVLVVLCWG